MRFLSIILICSVLFGSLAWSAETDGVDAAFRVLVQARDLQITNASHELEAAFAAEIQRVKTSRTLKLENQLEFIGVLESERELFLKKGEPPQSPKMKRHLSKFRGQILEAKKTFRRDARLLAEKFRDASDFESVAKILGLIDAENLLDEDRASDPMNNSKWDFLGVNQQRINGFIFTGDGAVVAESNYPEASWDRLSDDTILFKYGTEDSSCIIFHIVETGLMKGYHSGNGKVRYLRLIE